MNQSAIFITGANRGIGKGILKKCLANTCNPENIYIGVRDPEKTYFDFQKENIVLSRINIMHLDLEQNSSILGLVKFLKSRQIKVSA